jgi:tetratricopeptide (TPR) repeat protein
MNIMKILTAATVLVILAVSIIRPQAAASSGLLKEGIAISQQASAVYDQSLMLKAQSIFGKAYETDSTNPLSLYYITFTGYKLLEMNLQNKDAFEKYYPETEKNGERLSELKGMESEGKALLASIYMMKIASSPMSAISLSSVIYTLLGEAEKANAQNPRIYLVRGSMKFNTPKMFGGSYTDAAENFKKSVALFEKEDIADSLQPSWGYLESLAWLGRTYEQLENYEAAKFIYQKALSIDPEYRWIKYVLLPALEKQMANKNK